MILNDAEVEAVRRWEQVSPAKRITAYLSAAKRWPRFEERFCVIVWRAMNDEERVLAMRAMSEFDKKALAK